jgi:DNA-binding XRE family transcriptional regulator
MEMQDRVKARRTRVELDQQRRQKWWYLPGLRQVRMDQNMPQVELARLSGIHRPNLSRLENGGQRALWRTVIKLSKALKCAPIELIEEEHETEE